MARDLVSFFVRVPPELHVQLVEIANERGQSMSELARRALQDVVDRYRKSGKQKGDEQWATIGDIRRMIAEELAKK